jgi:hypothetical protein
MDEPRRRSGLSIWFAAAGSLIVGILIGFASGYRAGQGQLIPFPGAAQQERATPAPTSGATSSGQSFSESPVTDPVRVEPEPIVPAPATPSKAAPAPAVSPEPDRPVSKPAAPAPRAATVQRRATPPTEALPTGPGSVRVLSRPAGAQVLFDGRVVGKTPLEIGAVPAGEHSVRLELPGFKGWATTVDVKPGTEMRVAASLEE